MNKRLMMKYLCTKALCDLNSTVGAAAIYYANTICYSIERFDTLLYIYFLIFRKDNGCNVCHLLL